MGPKYYAVDPVLTNTNVLNDQKSAATSNGALVGGLNDKNLVAFSGVYASKEGKNKLTVSYSNSGNSAVTLGIQFNQINAGNIFLPTTGGNFATQSVVADLDKRKNFLSLLGGNENSRLETIQLSSL